jgi:glycosyltransferase involved in cell wall biosynthesis
VPTHNRAKYIGRAIRSLIGQSFEKKNFEIIVVDDGSKDNTSLILSSFKNDIKIIRNKKKLGLSASLNKAIKLSRSKYFLRVDSDDYVNKEYINFLYKMINENRDYNAAYCDYFLVDENENFIERVDAQQNPIACGVIFKTDDLRKIGMYSPKKKIFEEIDILSRLKKNKKYKMLHLKIPLYRYRMHDENMTKGRK